MTMWGSSKARRRRHQLHGAARARLNRARAQAPVKPRRYSEQARRDRTSPERPPAEAGATKKRANPAEQDQFVIDAKKADAAFKIALARLSSAFSRWSRFSSAESSVVTPGRA